jgi:hypothetical protein
LKVLVKVEGVKRHCGEEVEITVGYKSETFVLCEGDERLFEEQFFFDVKSLIFASTETPREKCLLLSSCTITRLFSISWPVSFD